MIRNLEVNESKIIDLNQRKRQMQRKAKLEREKRARQKFRTRVGIAAFALAIPALAVAHNNLTKATEPDVAIENEVTDDTIYADITDLNDLNLVLVNDGVQDEFMTSLANNLSNEGISIETINDSYNISNMNGSETYISFLDYNSDGKTKVIGQYNERENQTDPLAVSLNSCLQKNGLTDMGIQCGIKSYNDNGNLVLKEAPIENAVANLGANRFVTIAVDSNTDVSKFADSFTEGLLRFQEYVNKSDKFNLITRVSGGQTLDMIASNNDISLEYLTDINNITDNRIFMNETLKLSSYSPILTNKNIEINKNSQEKTY